MASNQRWRNWNSLTIRSNMWASQPPWGWFRSWCSQTNAYGQQQQQQQQQQINGPETKKDIRSSLTAKSTMWASQSPWVWIHSGCSESTRYNQKKKKVNRFFHQRRKRDPLTSRTRMWASQSRWQWFPAGRQKTISYSTRSQVKMDPGASHPDLSQYVDFSRRGAGHPRLSTKTTGGVPPKNLRIRDSLPKGHQGSLIHWIRSRATKW